MMTLENYCERLYELLDKPDEVLIKVCKPPSYISHLIISKQDDPVILIYKKEQNNKAVDSKFLNQVPVVSFSTNEVGNSLADLSLTGQPLECPFDKEESLDMTVTVVPLSFPKEYYHTPLSIQDARKCLAAVNLKLAPPSPIPVWVLTDMSDRNKSFLFGTQIKDCWRTRFWATVPSNQTEKIPIKDMLEDFEKKFNIKSGYKIQSEVCCVFDIKEDQRVLEKSKCFLEVHWQRPSYEVNTSQADTSLVIECSVGQEDSQISRWWKQLSLLHEYLQIIERRKDIKQVQDTYIKDVIRLPTFKSNEIESNGLPLASRLADLLQRSDSMSVCRQLGTDYNTTSALNSTIHELLDKQKGQDFTDRLWSLLIEAETYRELAESFQMVVREVRKQPIKPYIFVKNRTRLASLLRGIKSGGSEVELMFEPIEPLELMVEMGIEKLKRDYMFMFLASHIANEESLTIPKLPSFSELNSSEWRAAIDTWLQWLARLHTVLELVSVVHTTLPTPTLVQVTSLALSSYLGINSPVSSLEHLINSHCYHLRAQVVTKEVKQSIEGDKTFYKWMLKLTASSNKHLITSTYILLEKSPLPQAVLMHFLDESLNDTDPLADTVFPGSANSFSNVAEKYCYIQLFSVADKTPL